MHCHASAICPFLESQAIPFQWHGSRDVLETACEGKASGLKEEKSSLKIEQHVVEMILGMRMLI